MLDLLSERIQGVVRTLRGRGTLTDKNLADAMREIRMALIEADVNFRIAREFVRRTAEACHGEDVLQSVTPGQQFVRVVHEELTRLMGGDSAPGELDLSANPAVALMVGLHGSGKTTTSAKLARWARGKGRTPLLVACDVYRPAAIDQLETLGRQLDVPVYSDRSTSDPVAIAAAGLDRARADGLSFVVVDTAGRLHVDEDLIDEVRRIRAAIHPHEVLLVADAATGQEAVNIATRFRDAVEVTGIVLTKLDGDARGGAALSMREATGCPIRFVGMGEKTDALQPFHPERMASRILGMGDVLTLVERAQETVDQREAERLQKKLEKTGLDFEDFLAQLQQFRKMGSVEDVLGMIPGMPKGAAADMGDSDLLRVEAIIRSMTPDERRRPDILNAGRRRRIARGSGTSVSEVNQTVKQFMMMRKAMKDMGRLRKRMAAGGPGGLGGLGGLAGLGGGGGGSAGGGLRRALRRGKKKRK